MFVQVLIKNVNTCSISIEITRIIIQYYIKYNISDNRSE
jgi:hypothetical protein